MKKILFLFMILSFSFPIVNGMGISYGSTGDLFFEPGLEFNKSYKVVSVADGMDVEPYVKGDLIEYTTVSEIKNNQFMIHLILPDELSPGLYELIAGAKEVPKNPDKGMVFATGAQNMINVWSLYPEKYAEFGFEVENLNVNESVDFVIDASSYGVPTIDDIYGSIEVWFEGQIRGTLMTDREGLESKEKLDLVAKFNSEGYAPGEYEAKAKIYWDGEQEEITKSFRIGSLNIEVVNATNETFKNDIAEISVDIESRWNDEIKDAYVIVSINGLEIGKSANFDVGKFEKKKVSLYVDLHRLSVGRGDLEIELQYGGESSFFKSDILLKEPPKTLSLMTVILIILVIIAIISSIALFFVIRKSNKK